MKKIQVIYQDWASAGRCAYLGAVQRRGRTPPKRKPCRPLAHPRRHYQPTLTARETEVLALIAQGMTSKEIARSLGIDFRTVDAHRANIRNRFHLESSAALLRFAIDASKS